MEERRSLVVRGIYNATAQTYSIEVESKGGRVCLMTPDECKAFEEALYEARTAMPYKLQKTAENPV